MTLIDIAQPSWNRTVEFTPGAYLKARRTAQLLTLQDVAGRLPTSPHVPEHDRVEWLRRIEADLVPASIHTIDALLSAFRFDPSVLAALAAIANGDRDRIHTPRLCRICACSWRLRCVREDERCGWVDGTDLCTACDTSTSSRDCAERQRGHLV